MKNRIAVAVSLALLLGAVASPTALAGKKGKKNKKVTREATGEYAVSLGTTHAPSPFWIGSPIGNVTSVQFPVGVGERYVTVEIEDASGLPAGGTITADTDGDPTIQEVVANFCGKTEEPVKIPSGPIQVAVKSGVCEDGTTVLATSGTVAVTFSNIP